MGVVVSGGATIVPSNEDDSAFAIGSDKVAPLGALCDETSPDSVDEGDIGAVRMTADRKLLTCIVSSSDDTKRLEIYSPSAPSPQSVLLVGGYDSENDELIRLPINDQSASDRAVYVHDKVLRTNVRAQGTAYTPADVGTAPLAIRQDTQAALSLDGEYVPLTTTSTGALRVDVAVRNEGLSALGPVDGESSRIAVTDGGAAVIAALDAQITGTILPVGGANNGDGTVSVKVIQPFFTRGDNFPATGDGVSVDASATPVSHFSLMVEQSGGVTVWDVRLEYSLDGSNWTQVIQHTNTDGSGTTKSNPTTLPTTPALYFRSRCAGITGGTSLFVTILGMQ